MMSLDWQLLLVAAAGGAGLGLLVWAALPHRADERTRSDSEPQ